jgi:hypothetical protein
LKATAAVYATQTAQAIVSQIGQQLKRYGLMSEEGYLGWAGSKPITLKVTAYKGADFQFIDKDLTFRNFVFQTDVTWESTQGLAACGIIFRAEPNIDTGAYYEFWFLRLSGLPAWVAYRLDDGLIQAWLTKNLNTNAAIDQDQGSTNTITVIAQDDIFTFYANGERLGRVVDNKLREGMIAVSVHQNSGETTCKFDNSWVWVLK